MSGAKPRLLLVEPTRLDRDDRPVRLRREGMRTLTLPYLAGMTPPGWDVSLAIDSLEPVTGGEDADLVGITVLTQRAPRAYAVADRFRARGVPVVMGGAHVTLNSEEAAEHADAIVIGEAEDVWAKVVADAAAGRLQRAYRASEFHDLRGLPTPDFSLIRNRRYFTLLRPIQTTRGCPHPCEFCTVRSIYGHRYRHRPVDEIVEDVRRVRRDSRYVFFVDDNLAADRRFALDLFEALIPLRISWSAQLNLNIADDAELLATAVRSGFQMAVCGIENVNTDSLADVGKHRVNRPERYHEQIETLRRAGVIVLAGMILGFDSDDEASIARNVEFMVREKIPMISLYILTPFPGTALFARWDAEGRILTRDWSRYDSYTGVYRPRYMSAERLTELYWRACRTVTTVPHILRRFMPPPLPRLRTLGPDLLATSIVFSNNLVLFRKDARREQPPRV